MTLNQLYFANDFAMRSATDLTQFSIGPAVPQGLFLSTSSIPKLLTTGVTQQASFAFDVSNAGILDETICRPSNGAYVVHEVTYASDGTLTVLAADFSAACTLGYMTNMTGALRYHSSVPVGLSQTFVIPGLDHAVTEGAVVVLDGSLSWNPSSRVSSITWSQLSGPPFDLSNCSLGVCTTYAPLVTPGGATAIFQLRATSESGQTATANLQVQIRSWRDRQSRVDIFGAGYVAGHEDLSFTELDGPFEVPIKDGTESVFPDQTSERMEIRYHGNATYGRQPVVPPQLVLSNSQGIALLPGSYSGSVRAGFVPFSFPAFDFIFDGRECGQPDWLATIAALDRNPVDLTQIDHAAIFFEDRCAEGGGELDPTVGRFWIDYQPVLPPIAVASGPASANVGQPFVIQEAGSSTPAGSWLFLAWRQVFGTPVQSLISLPDGSAQVVAAMTTPPGSSVVFAYEVIDSLGQSGVTLVSVPIIGGTAQASIAAKPRYAMTSRRVESAASKERRR